MKANELEPEVVEAFIETEEGRAFMRRRDIAWNDVMDAARTAGFIIQACGGASTLCTLNAMYEANGAQGVARMLRMNAIELGEVG